MPRQFSHKETLQQNFFERSHFFIRKTKKIVVFEAPFWRLGATYAVHLRLIGKLVGDFLLVIVELFSIGAFVLPQFTRLTDGETDGRTDGRTDRCS